jgi:nucleoside-triphosphatase
MKSVYLLTGKPGSGKTSLIKQALSGIGGKAGGFYTEEIRPAGEREGFRIVTLDGQNAILAHTGIRSQYRVSKYGVDLTYLEQIGVSTLRKAALECPLVVIDEIGKMELFSPLFRNAIWDIIESGKPVLGTIMLNPHPWADIIKAKSQVNIINVTRNNHPEVLAELKSWLIVTEILV